MSLVSRIVGASRPQARTGGEDTLWIREGFFASRAGTGEVTVERSFRLDAVFAAVRLRSDSVGALPLKTYQRMRGGGRVEAWFEPVYRLLHDEPNPEMTAIALWSLAETHLATWGNAYLGKERTGGRVTAIWPLAPERMKVSRAGGVKAYCYRDERGQEHDLDPADLIHIWGLSLDGLVGLSPIAYARDVVGAGIAGVEFAARFFRNSATPRGVIEIPGELDNDTLERLRDSWNAAHRGPENMHKVAVLEGGAKFNPISMPLEDAQFVEQSKLSVQQIARIFGVSPELIGGESGGSLTYSTVEGQSLHFLTYGLRPDLVRIEQALARDRELFPGEGRAMYPEFLAEAMLRTDVSTRSEVYARALDPVTGWMSRAEVRALENLPPEQPATPEAALATAARDATARVIAELAATNGGARHARA